MRYKTPAALDAAVKAAAKTSPMETSRAIRGFYTDRFLCRVFRDGASSFVLKGGQSILARTISARTTKDIDLLTSSGDLDRALEELRRIASIDLDDFITFEYIGYGPIKNNDEYRSGYRVAFRPRLGTTVKDNISIDLVADTAFREEAERISPVERLDVGDLEASDYYLYPVKNAIADKVCITMQRFNGHDSSRVKDLVDLAVIAATQCSEGTAVRLQIQTEARLRKMNPISSFEIPESWRTIHRGVYQKGAESTDVLAAYPTVEDAYELVRSFIQPVLEGDADGKTWNPSELTWKPVSADDPIR